MSHTKSRTTTVNLRLDSLFLKVIAGISGTLLACAAPVPPAANVVIDADVRDCSPNILRDAGPLDVAIVIDTSQSTGRPTGFDIDGDGEVLSFQRNRLIDRGDSRLAAQVAAIRRLFLNAGGRDIRFSIITFAGPSIQHTVGRTHTTGSIRDSRVRLNLTNDFARLDSVLNDLLDRGSEGRTIFSAGMQRATRSLITSRTGQDSRRRKVVLFMSDSARPNSLDPDGSLERVDPRMKNAAVSARGHRVVFHTFGLSPNSRTWRAKALGQIAGATGGTYHPVEDPRHFYCHLAKSIAPPSRHTGRLRMLAADEIEPSRASSDAVAPEQLAERR
jgi:Mg-chelatase subunit ChlD